MHVVVYGAGAVGSVLGGMLSLQKHDVHLVCRRPHALAVTGDGLKIRSATGNYVARPRATESLAKSDLHDDTCILFTVKSQHTDEAMEQLAAAASPERPIVSFQNGVGNEAVLGRHFQNVYGGVCRMTCSMVQPGHASFRRMGRLIVGRHPKGADPLARSLVKALTEAGFDACASRAIESDKWLKLAVNTKSAFNAVIDPRDHDANEFYELEARLLEEVKAVYKAAKIRARSCDGKDPSLDEMIAELRRPHVRRADQGLKVNNSTWQDLYLKRKTIESPLFHRPIVELGATHSVPTPYNETAIELVERVHHGGEGPGTLRLSGVLENLAKKGAWAS